MIQHSTRVQELDERSFQSEVIAAELPVLVDFTASWCSPCRALVPVLDRLAEQAAGKLKIACIDAEQHPALSARYGVRAFPTVIAFVGGNEVGRHVGLTTAAKLRALFGAIGA